MTAAGSDRNGWCPVSSSTTAPARRAYSRRRPAGVTRSAAQTRWWTAPAPAPPPRRAGRVRGGSAGRGGHLPPGARRSHGGAGTCLRASRGGRRRCRRRGLVEGGCRSGAVPEVRQALPDDRQAAGDQQQVTRPRRRSAPRCPAVPAARPPAATGRASGRFPGPAPRWWLCRCRDDFNRHRSTGWLRQRLPGGGGAVAAGAA